ncbi:phosphatase PAP2 family protein [Companilactobacillus zhongbaensis]|uniref:phosphatase PAP2 family protein n=1 Tax=Companilactobacillus zhongbaensis TaxID=2486009 RepID=UPI000F77FD0A|nr:phosphatase PAP2 family protein [Companilactobacillus zhongbaensis]
MISKKFLWTSEIILIILFILWTYLVATNAALIHDFDNFFIDLFYQNHTQNLLAKVKFLTNIGGTFWTIVISVALVIILIVKKYYYAAIFLASNKLIVVTLNTIIKDLIRRPRPDHHHFVFESSLSYPSGHSSSALSLYIPLLIICWFVFKKISSRVIVSTLATLMIIIIGASRIYLGVHYPSDVFGGYLLALVVLILTILFMRSKNIFILDLKGIKQQGDDQ